MYRIHTTANGDTMLIAQMEPSHLLNTLKLHLRTVRDTRTALAAINAGRIVQDPLVKALSPRTVDLQHLRQEAERKLQSTHSLLADYRTGGLGNGIKPTGFSRGIQNGSRVAGQLQNILKYVSEMYAVSG